MIPLCPTLDTSATLNGRFASLRGYYTVDTAFLVLLGQSRGLMLSMSTCHSACCLCDGFDFEPNSHTRDKESVVFRHRSRFIAGEYGPQSTRTLYPIPAMCVAIPGFDHSVHAYGLYLARHLLYTHTVMPWHTHLMLLARFHRAAGRAHLFPFGRSLCFRLHNRHDSAVRRPYKRM